MKMKKSSLKKINKFNKKVSCLFFALLMMVSIATPAFAAVNVEGQGGTSANVTGGGAYTYNVSDQMWKISKKSDVKCYEQDARYFYNFKRILAHKKVSRSRKNS